MERFFESKSKLIEFLISDLGFSDEDAHDFELVDEQTEPNKRAVLVYGYIHDPQKDVYYSLYHSFDYDWGSYDFTIDTTPNKREKFLETVTIEQTRYIPLVFDLKVQENASIPGLPQ